jgi:hypothetical protein
VSHGDRIGYVVVEWNQASGMPRLMYGADLYDDEVDAWADAHGEHRVNRQNNRREHYGVAALVLRGKVEDQ